MAIVQGAEFHGTTAKIIIILNIVACFMSISAVILVLTWWNLHVTRIQRPSRHRLIIYLLSCDLFKAVILILHPCLNFTYSTRMDTYPYSSPICDGLGFMTTYALANVDFANLFLALNTLISVFAKENTRGLPKLRRILYVVIALIPIICASCGMISYQDFGTGYTYFASSCYLRFDPIWYRIVLVWAPRLFIMLTIAVIYFAIYVRLRNQIKRLEKTFSCMNDLETGISTEIYGPANCFQRALRHIALRFPGLGFLMRYGKNKKTEKPLQDDSSATTRYHTPQNDLMQLKDIMQSDNYRRFQQSRALMERNVNMVFIYPVVYFFIWMFPLAEDCMGLHYKLTDTPPAWLSVVALFMRSIEGFVDSVVFMIKEMIPSESSNLATPGRRPSDPSAKTKRGSALSTYRNSLSTLKNSPINYDKYLDTEELVAEGILNQKSVILRDLEVSSFKPHFSASAFDVSKMEQNHENEADQTMIDSPRNSVGRSNTLWKKWRNSNPFTTSRPKFGSKEALPATGESEIDLFDILKQGPQELKPIALIPSNDIGTPDGQRIDKEVQRMDI